MWRLFPLAAILVVGCAPRNPYLGTWGSEVTVQGMTVQVTHTFAEQGVYGASLKSGDITGRIAGTYSYEGDRLTITPQSFDLDTSKAGVFGKLADQFRPEVEKEMKKPQAGKVVWKEGAFTVTPDAPNVPAVVFAKVSTP